MTKVPFREQATEYDCVPTSFVNALAILFDREEIPPAVLQRIYLYSLDTVTSRQQFGHGTSCLSVKLLATHLSGIKTTAFRLNAEVYENDAVHLGSGNPIAACLNKGGVALMRVKDIGADWHYILGLRIIDDWMECYDPYGRSPKKGDGFEIQTPTSLHGWNVRVTRARLDAQTNKKRYCFGTIPERQCVLLSRS